MLKKKIAVEGNIASGKSSIIRYLQTKFEMPSVSSQTMGILDDLTETAKSYTGMEMSPRKRGAGVSSCGASNETSTNKRININLKVLTEPVHLWRDLNGANLLDLMYADPAKWAYPFHSYVQLTMLQNHLEIAQHGLGVNDNTPTSDEHFISIMERSLFSARYCFVENLFRK